MVLAEKTVLIAISDSILWNNADLNVPSNGISRDFTHPGVGYLVNNRSLLKDIYLYLEKSSIRFYDIMVHYKMIFRKLVNDKIRKIASWNLQDHMNLLD